MRLTHAFTVAIVAAAAPFAHATVLTFDQDPPVADFDPVDQGYGDRVTSTSMPGNFGYGSAGGFTPNVVTSYGPAGSDPNLWTTGYGSRTNVLFEDNDNFGILRVTLTADPGYAVSLSSFLMSAYNPAFASPPTINYIRVLGPGDVELFRQNNAAISETTFTTFDFSVSPLAGQSIAIEFNSANLGGLSDDIAFDDITFSQVVVPEPTAAVAALAGLTVAGARRRRRGT